MDEETKEKELSIDEEDYDYDFSIYDDIDAEADATNVDEEAFLKQEARVKNLRSRYSNFGTELDRLAQLNALCTKYAIKVESGTQDVGELRKFLGILNEMWFSMEPIHGTVMQNKVRSIKNRCKELLNDKKNEHGIPEVVHNNLLYYRVFLYNLRQMSNLGYDVDIKARGYADKARKMITQ